MNARLCSLLVAGGVTLVATQGSHLYAASIGVEVRRHSSTLQGMNLEGQAGNAVRLVLDVPGFQGTPQLQLLTNPDRVVVDLPGVLKGMGVNRKDLLGIDPALVVRSRIAQFSTFPEPVTRLVFETRPGVRIQVSTLDDQIHLSIGSETGEGKSQLTQSHVTPLVTDSAIESEEVVLINQVPFTELSIQNTQARSIQYRAPEYPVVLSEIKPIASLSSLPFVGSSSSSFPAMGLSSLMPTVVPTAPVLAVTQVSTSEPVQESSTHNSNKQAGRTLGETSSKYTGAKMSIDVQGADLITFLRILADAGKLNLIVDQDVQGTYSFKFTDTPWDQILDLVLKNAGLGKDLQNGVLRVAKVDKLQKEENDRKSLEEAKSLAGETQSVTRSLSYAKASEAKVVLEKVLTKRGSVILDDRTNTLIISDLPKNLSLVDDLIATLDVQIQQVQIEAKIVEASDGYEKAFGVSWPKTNSGNAQLSIGGAAAPWGFGQSWNSVSNKPDGTNNPLGVAFSPGASGVTSIAGAAGEAWVSFISERFSVNFILQALEKEGKVKIVSSPKLVTQNNKKAKILSGEKIPYPAQQGGAAGGAITVAFASANLELNVTPQITSEGTIIMDIKIEKSEADFSRTVNGTPTILQKEIETQVLVRDGGTAVLGGVYSTNKSNGFAGVPFLSKLPFVGGLFRTRSNKDQNSELLIFITPRVIKN